MDDDATPGNDSGDEETERETIASVISASDDDENDSVVTSPMKRKPSFVNEHDAPKKIKSIKKAYREQIISYYGSGTGFGSPLAGLMYSLACQLGRNSIEFLW